MGPCIGLDAHARTCTYCVKDEHGTILDRNTIPSTPDALLCLARRFPTASIVLEASSVHEWIYDLFTDHGFTAVACHPRNIRGLLGKKSDKIDSEFLCDCYRLGVLPLSYVPSKEVRRLRELVRRRAFLVQERTRLKNRVQSLLRRKGWRVAGTEGPGVDVFALKHRDALLSLPHPELPVLLRLIDAVNEELRAADKAVEAAGAVIEDVQHLRTIPGFGPLVALGFYAEVGDVARFPHPAKLTAYFGLVPAESQSGDRVARGHLTKRGSETARWLLGQAAWVHVRRCPRSSLSKDYKRASKRLGNKRAIVRVSRKLVKVGYWVLKEKRSFRLTG